MTMRLEDEFEKLIEAEDIDIQKKSKIESYQYRSVSKNAMADFEKDGWEVQKEFKTKVRMRKKKNCGVYFEDRVWSLMANLGFQYMNRDNEFKILYSEKEGLTQQIDVFAANEEVVLVIECKAAEKLKTKDFSKDINEFGQLKEKLRRRIQKYCNGTPKFAFMFCTDNCIVGEQDQKRLKDNNIIWFNQDDIQYYEGLIQHIKKAAIYQFLGRVFAKKDIANMKSLVPAIRGKMGGYCFYSFAIEPSILLQISYVLHRVQTTEKSLTTTYQRFVKTKRISEIQDFLDKGGFFPNAIILNIDTPKGKPLVFDFVGNEDYDSNTKIGILHLPKQYHCAYIIDGQHRLYGYAGSKYCDKNTIPVIAFENLPAERQANLFVEINSKQKSVSKNLLTTLDAELRWNSDNRDDAIRALKSKLLQKLQTDQLSPLYKLISIGESIEIEKTSLTLSYLFSYGFSRTNFFGLLQKKTIIRNGYLCDKDSFAEDSLNKAFEYFKLTINYLKEKNPELWDPKSSAPIFLKNIGIAGLFRLLNDILEHLEKTPGFICNTTSSKSLFEHSKCYLEILSQSLTTAVSNDFERLASFSSCYGSGGPEKMQRQFQAWINSKCKDFNPDGLDEYQRDNAGNHNEEVHKLLLDFSLEIQKAIFTILKKSYGDEVWWYEGIPGKIQGDCAKSAVAELRKYPDEHYLESYEQFFEVVIYRWNLLGKVFADSSVQGQSKRKDKIKWLKDFDDYQKRVSKPARDPITDKEFAKIQDVIDRISNNLSNVDK